MARANSREIVSADAHATAVDFEQIFAEDMSGLYLLSFLLTGNPDRAEECFVASVGESTKGNCVFKEWARSWARRTIIQSAIRLIVPQRHSERAMRNPAVARTIEKLPLVLRADVSAILELAPFERFVFVMSTLERYSDHDCSILLACARRDVTGARVRALRQLGRLMNFPEDEVDAASEDLAGDESPGPVIKLTIAQYFATPAWSRSLSHETPVWP
jgi:DNA-directed RNA polymerase specialized sigma24 family protein